jgi:hypothetical protein
VTAKYVAALGTTAKRVANADYNERERECDAARAPAGRPRTYHAGLAWLAVANFLSRFPVTLCEDCAGSPAATDRDRNLLVAL